MFITWLCSRSIYLLGDSIFLHQLRFSWVFMYVSAQFFKMDFYWSHIQLINYYRKKILILLKMYCVSTFIQVCFYFLHYGFKTSIIRVLQILSQINFYILLIFVAIILYYIFKLVITDFNECQRIECVDLMFSKSIQFSYQLIIC